MSITNLKELLDQVTKRRPVGEEETVVIRNVPKEIQDMYDEITDVQVEVLHEAARLEKKRETIFAKTKLMWSKIEDSTEQTETAEMRGRTLGYRFDANGDPVIVELDIPPAGVLGELLKKMME